VFLRFRKESDNEKPAATSSEKQEKENFPVGSVIDKIVCKSDTSQSYALYLPKSYHPDKTYPVIYSFDAHGTGKLPVSNYRDLAEKYGYIIIGSNNSKNGLSWEQTKDIAGKLFNDSRNRLSINNNRIYLMGFSGGARVANGLTLSDNSISGVICSGAAAPAVNPPFERNGYTFFGIGGNADFNYIEMKKYNLFDLAGKKVKHAFISFDGKHEWPDSAVMEEAFFWLELNNMRKDVSTKKDSLINFNLQEKEKELKALLKETKDFEAYELTAKTINYYEGLGDLNFFFETYKKLQTSQLVDKKLREQETAIVKEEKLQQEYVNYLQTKDAEWLQKDITAINREIKSGKNKDEVLVKKRLLSYLSLVCYMQTSAALKQNNIPAAEYFGQLYILVDPTNKEAYYLLAEVNAIQKKNKEALNLLEQAIKNGFDEKKRIENDSVFTELKTDATFAKMLEGMK
jgi:hypothetical protein